MLLKLWLFLGVVEGDCVAILSLRDCGAALLLWVMVMSLCPGRCGICEESLQKKGWLDLYKMACHNTSNGKQQLVVVVALFSLARILGGNLTIHSPPAFFFFFLLFFLF